MSILPGRMADEQSRAWNAWGKALVQKELAHAAKAVGDALGKNSKDVQAALDRRDTRIASLEARLASVEALVESAKEHVQ